MNVLVCVKRVPAPGASIVLTEDGLRIDDRLLGFTVSPHEECAVEEAVRLVEAHGGASTVLTLGSDAAEEQLRQALAIGVDHAVLLETDGAEWGPAAIAGAIAEAVDTLEAEGQPFDLVLFGNESADAANFQIGIRVARALGRPVVSGIKAIDVGDGTVTLHRGVDDGFEVCELPLPAVAAVKEGLNLPRYPTMRGRLRAARTEVQRMKPLERVDGLATVGLRHPAQVQTETEVLGSGPDAVPAVMRLLDEAGLL